LGTTTSVLKFISDYGNIQKPRDIETRHAAIAERMGSKVKYNCDSETTVSSRTAKVILITL